MRMPKYIVHRVDVDGLTVTLTDVTDSVIVNEIDNTPSVLPSREEGEWMPEKDSYEIICNKCGCEAFSKYGDWFETDYCPNCGAKMKHDEVRKKVCTMNFQGPWCNECTQFWNCDILAGKAKEQVIEK